MGEALVATDVTGRTIFWNRAAEDMYGWTADEVVGRQTLDTLAGAAADPMFDEVVERLLAGSVWAGDVERRHRDGSTFPTRVTITPLRGEDGAVVAVISVVRDITERQRAEDRMRALSAIVESSGSAIIGNDLDGRVQTWNAAAEHLYGYTAAEAIGRTSESLVVPPERRGEITAIIDAVRAGRPVGPIESVRQRRDGSLVDVAVTVSPMHDGAGRLVGVSAIAHDVTERKRLEREREEDRARLAEAQRVAGLGSFGLDLSTAQMSWSNELHRIVGVAPGATVGPKEYLARTHPEDLEQLLAAFGHTLPPRQVDLVHRLCRPDGELRWVHVRTKVEEDGARTRVLGTVLDITERKLAEDEVVHRARHDALTGLPNRVLLAERLGAALAQRGSPPRVAAMFLDVDQFKVINDSMGHAVGDQLLVLLGRRLRAAVAAGDLVARFGGDEFVIVSEDVDEDGAVALARRLCDRLAEPAWVDGVELIVTVSAGVAVATGGHSADALLRDADAAMYRAKERGRARVELFVEDLGSRARRRLATDNALRRALARGELDLAYQPVVELGRGRVVAVEALLRWNHPDLGVLDPVDFIPLAEESGLIVPIGRWVLRRALRQLGRWRRTLPGAEDLHMAVNLSSRQLGETDLAHAVQLSAADAGVPLDALHLEITESVLMDDAEEAADTLRELDGLGVRIDVDDFGTGYSSFSYLKRFPIGCVKIDRSFVDGVGFDAEDTTIVAAIIKLAADLGLCTIAEGVESPRHEEQLRQLGCHFAQGHLWTPALRADALAEWFVAHTAASGAAESR